MNQRNDIPEYARNLINMASPKLGARVVHASDEFFAAKERLISDSAPEFFPDKYDNHGKWMDGWETRRKRKPGHDFCLIQLGAPVSIKGFCIDTSYFTGNFPPAASVDAIFSRNEPSDDAAWRPLTDKVTLQGDEQAYIDANSSEPVNWLRLNIFPDGGVARLRVYGEAHVDWDAQSRNQLIELTGILNGGSIVDFNDAHYGSLWTLLAPGSAENMGDGWETRRRRTPGNDWIIVRLGAPGTLESVEIDTSFFKGNYPDRFSLDGALVKDDPTSNSTVHSLNWSELIPQTMLEADNIASFDIPDANRNVKVSHLRLNIYPDGGVARFRAVGRLG